MALLAWVTGFSYSLPVVVVASCPLCHSPRIRVVVEQPHIVMCACDTCYAQFTVTTPVRIERRRVAREA
jgi:hypothetical protein